MRLIRLLWRSREGSHMSKLDELLADLCPKGVEFRKLSDVCFVVEVCKRRKHK